MGHPEGSESRRRRKMSSSQQKVAILTCGGICINGRSKVISAGTGMSNGARFCEYCARNK